MARGHEMTGLENFTLNMSQEACHYFAGAVLGQGTAIKILLLLILYSLLTPMLKDTGKYFWENIKDYTQKQIRRTRRRF